MNAVIMAGGFGTRLKPLTDNLCKPMMPIVGKPILEYTVELLVRHGVDDIAMTLNYRPFDIIDYFGDGSSWGVNIRYVVEDEPLGTAGSVKNAKPMGDDFIVISGDAFTDINLTELLSFHRSSDALVTMAVKRVENPLGFGVVETQGSRIVRFKEKPIDAPSGSLVNTGIYAIKREVLDLIPNGFYDFSKQLFPEIIGHIAAFETDAYWSDIGTLENYYLTNIDALRYDSLRA